MLEFADITLQNKLNMIANSKDVVNFNLSDLLVWLCDILRGITHLTSMGIVHRDLRLVNNFFTKL